MDPELMGLLQGRQSARLRWSPKEIESECMANHVQQALRDLLQVFVSVPSPPCCGPGENHVGAISVFPGSLNTMPGTWEGLILIDQWPL